MPFIHLFSCIILYLSCNLFSSVIDCAVGSIARVSLSCTLGLLYNDMKRNIKRSSELLNPRTWRKALSSGGGRDRQHESDGETNGNGTGMIIVGHTTEYQCIIVI
jgi:hypothetical protein